MSGTVRGRLGYAPGHWLVYATGGLTWTYNEFTRTQLAGTPVGGNADPDTTESLFLRPRFGGTVGAGVEVRAAIEMERGPRVSLCRLRNAQRKLPARRAALRFQSNRAEPSVGL